MYRDQQDDDITDPQIFQYRFVRRLQCALRVLPIAGRIHYGSATPAELAAFVPEFNMDEIESAYDILRTAYDNAAMIFRGGEDCNELFEDYKAEPPSLPNVAYVIKPEPDQFLLDSDGAVTGYLPDALIFSSVEAAERALDTLKGKRRHLGACIRSILIGEALTEGGDA